MEGGIEPSRTRRRQYQAIATIQGAPKRSGKTGHHHGSEAVMGPVWGS